MSSLIKTEQDIKEAASAISNILVRELAEKPYAMRFLGKPEMVELASKPGELRFEPRKAAEFYLSLPHVKLPVRITFKLAGLNSFKKGLGPLLEALAGNEQFVDTVAVVYGADPISRKELEDELYEHLGEHGEDFLVELAKEKGREALIDERHGLVWFALNAWYGSKAASALPDLGLVPSEVSQVLEDWMIDRGYPSVAH